MKTFNEMVEAIEENNRINNASWKDWTDMYTPEDCYGKLKGEYRHVARAFLHALIRDNGDNLQVYKDAYQCLEWGYTV